MDAVHIAENTSCSTTLLSLVTNPSMNVRRAVARNHYAPKDALLILSDDPVLNVSHVARKRIGVEKEIDSCPKSLRPCVLCEVPETKLNCEKCSYRGVYAG